LTGTEFLQQLLNGLFLGAIYGLIALGYSMIYGVLRFINFAHGDIFMLGAFAAFYLAGDSLMGMGIAGGVIILLLAMAACSVTGVVIEKLAYRPLRSRPKLTVLITAIGVSLLLEFGGQLIFGARPKSFPDIFPKSVINFAGGNLTVTSTQIIVLIVTATLLLVLRHLVMKTRLGMAMRAISANPQAAALMGVNIDTVISFTFAIGSALAAAGGVLYALTYTQITPLMGIMPGLKAFVAAVLGGIGNLTGAVLGALILGVIEALVGGSSFSTYRDAIAFALLILILLFRPGGLLGSAKVEKV
jgi:branched-chain amino acid transport system permease protein